MTIVAEPASRAPRPRHIHAVRDSGRARLAAVCAIGILVAIIPMPGIGLGETTGGFAWIRQFGTDSTDLVFAAGADASGAYIAGYTIGAFPGETNAGYIDAFLGKYNSDGTAAWVHQLGSSAIDIAGAVAAAASGVYVAGSTEGVLPGQTGAGGPDAFLRKYDRAGAVAWTLQFGTPAGDSALAVAADPSGVYVAGGTGGTFPGQTRAGDYDAYLQKYDPNGTLVWTRQFGTVAGDDARAVAADGSGAYVAGLTTGTFPGQTSAGGADAYLQKYDQDGTLIWTRQFGTSGTDEPRGLAADGSGAYVAGLTDGTLPGQVNAGSQDAFLWKFDGSGNDAWTREFGTSATDIANGVAITGSHVYVVGYTQGTFPGQVSGGDDAFLRKYDADGNVTWMHQFGTPTSDSGDGVAANGSRVYVAGYTFGTFPGETNFGGGTDAFIALAAETPDAPENVRAAPGNALVDLTWDPPAVDGGAPITDYKIYRGTTSGSLTFSAEVGPVLTYRDVGLTNGVPYYYQVSAVNAVGDSPLSIEVSATPAPTPPSAPRNLAGTPGDGRVVLDWIAPSSNGGSAIMNYSLYRGATAGAETLLATLGNVSAFTDLGLINGDAYYYRVSAVNGIGEGPMSPEVSVTPFPPDTTPPSVTISSPEDGAIVAFLTITATGIASDDIAVEKVELSTDGATWVLASGATSWSTNLTLHAGSNTITARATDTSGNVATTTITVTVKVAEAPPGGSPLPLFGILAGGGIAAAAIAAAVYILRRRRRGDA